MKKDIILQEIYKRKAVAVLRVKETEKLKNVINAINKGGVSIIEITMSVPNACYLIEKMTEEINEDIIIGVGTVLDKATEEKAIKAGAKFVVSPILKKEIIDTAKEHEIPVMPGCFTPTEVQTAYEWGADIIKIFPADVVGIPFFKAILAPMPYLKLMPTGGVSLTNAGEWIKAGACAVGLGSALIDNKAIAEGNYNKLTENAITIMNSIKSVDNKGV
jgi:2-dehydro-3-deoxyphosphogluconate aldolase/(4S)-4-hydroxy-2-oxoglutarate aldolase